MTKTDARRAPWPPGERGSVTLETAFAISGLLAVLVGCLWCVGVGLGVLKCQDAARNAARSLARGESFEQARSIAHQSAPDAIVTFDANGETVTATVRQRIKGTLPILDRVGVMVERSVVATREE